MVDVLGFIFHPNCRVSCCFLFFGGDFASLSRAQNPSSLSVAYTVIVKAMSLLEQDWIHFLSLYFPFPYLAPSLDLVIQYFFRYRVHTFEIDQIFQHFSSRTVDIFAITDQRPTIFLAPELLLAVFDWEFGCEKTSARVFGTLAEEVSNPSAHHYSPLSPLVRDCSGF